MLNPTQPLKRPSQERGCCCQIRLYTLYYITKSLPWIQLSSAYNQMSFIIKHAIQLNTAFEEAFQGWGVGGRGVICCCFFRSFLRLLITWWVSPGAILPVVSTPWKSSLKYKADFSLAIWAPKDKIDSNKLIVLAILKCIYSFTFREHKFCKRSTRFLLGPAVCQVLLLVNLI